MENLLQGIPRVVVRVDDILITGSSKSEHLNNLETVLGKIQESGMRLNKEKCVFLAPEVVYLAHRIDQYGKYPVESKVKAITEAPEPKNVTELKSYLGMLNYYNRFLPDLSSNLAPLHGLLKKQKQWEWDKSQREAFELSKTLLKSSKVLVHYDPNKDIILSCDASPYGIGAVLSHKMEDGCDRPVGYVSRTLAPAERNYSVLEKFTIYTDHKPLIGLFNENKCIPPMAAARIQRWALTLSAYEYKIVYKEGKKNSNADALSRLPLNREGKTEVPAEMIMLMDHMDSTPVTAQQIKAWTRKDPILGQITNYVLKGWPNYRDNDEMKSYFSRKTELSVFDSCLLWGNRVVIPNPGRKIILQELHEGHQGISRMKVLARDYVWWPNMDAEIEQTVRACHKCQVNRHAPPEAPMHPWEWPSKPWSRIHIDYAGPLYGKMFLVCVDAHSKYLDVHVVNSATSTNTIEKLRTMFAIHGLPESIVEIVCTFLSHNREAKWITGTLIKRTGPVSFVIELNDGRTVKRHQNQIRHKYDQYSDNKLPDISEIPDVPIPSVSNNQTDVEAVCDSNADSSDTNDNSKSVMKSSVATPRPTRTRKPPNRYGDFVYN
ncbi:Uncharacterized protein K02A2.6 [Mytilus coruscus]|uniref:Uncharacterized protein K02A2.6 n=1 Tax=Mytilus coruscus TaxID=42192 RepID=A0A6J8E8C9_MYTCO|nr:Uncharacterized protein K02A2.6 [Mytilus coruscus]